MTEQWQELKETIIEMRDNDGTGTQHEVCKFLANYMDNLEKQIQEPRCIPCSERLPEDEGDYLVTFELSFMNFVEVCTFNKYGWDKGGYDEVIAWMPSPEPYYGGESDAE